MNWRGAECSKRSESAERFRAAIRLEVVRAKRQQQDDRDRDPEEKQDQRTHEQLPSCACVLLTERPMATPVPETK